MRPEQGKASAVSRWVLILSEVVLLVYYLLIGVGRVDPRNVSSGFFIVFEAAVSLAWVFLFLGSPFLVKNHKWLAIFGWGLSFGALYFAQTLKL